MARMHKWLCVEALEATDDKGKGLGHVKYLVTDKDGTYVGVKLLQLADGEKKDLDNAERFEPRKQIRRESLELMRAIKRKMLKVHYPKGHDPKKGHKNTAIAATVRDAFEAFGLDAGSDVGGGHPSQSAKQRAGQRQKKKAKTTKKAAVKKAAAKPKTPPADADDTKGSSR